MHPNAGTLSTSSAITVFGMKWLLSRPSPDAMSAPVPLAAGPVESKAGLAPPPVPLAAGRVEPIGRVTSSCASTRRSRRT